MKVETFTGLFRFYGFNDAAVERGLTIVEHFSRRSGPHAGDADPMSGRASPANGVVPSVSTTSLGSRNSPETSWCASATRRTPTGERRSGRRF